MLCAKGKDLPNELCTEPGNCQVWNMVHSVFGGFLHCWVQGDRNRSSAGRNQLTSTSQGFVLVFFSQYLVPNLTTRTNYQAPVKNCGQSSLAIAGHCSRLYAETPPCPMASGRPGSGDQRVEVGLWLQLLGGSLLKVEGQQTEKLLHGRYGGAGDIAEGTHAFGQH